MMRRFPFAFPLAILAASFLGAAELSAQRGLVQEGIPLRKGDIERLNPASVILSRRRDLRIEKPQVARLDSLRKVFDDSAKAMAEDVKKYQRAITTAPPLLRRPSDARPETRKDSLERARLDSTNREKRDRYFGTVTAGRRDLATTLLALKELFDTTLAATIAALNGSQHTAAALSLEQASEEFTRRLRLANIR
jgi:hypothetical protein